MTNKLKSYSTTPGSNNSAVPNGFPEGIAVSGFNNAAREMMARLREWYEDAEWIDHGHSIQSSTGSTIVVSGDKTDTYSAGRPIRVNQSGSQVGRVTSSSYSAPNTTINVEGFTVSSPTQVEVGVLSGKDSLPDVEATQAEMEAGTATDVYVTPANIKYSPFSPKCGALIDSDGTILHSFGGSWSAASVGGSNVITVTLPVSMSSATDSMIVDVTPHANVGSSTPVSVHIQQTAADTVKVEFHNTVNQNVVTRKFSIKVWGDM